jgi:hypothetical protein
MTQTISLPPADQNGFLARLWKDPEQRSVVVGIIAVILIHLILAVLAPWLFKTEPTHFTKRKAAQPQVFNIEMAPELFPKVAPPPKQKIVEANPNAPENIPDKTNNIADRNQQAAQEHPKPKENADMAATEGRKDIQTNAVVTGRLSKPQEAVPPAPPEVSKTASVAKPKAEMAPLSGIEKTDGKDVDGFKSGNSKPADVVKDVSQITKGSKDTPIIQDANVAQAQVDPKRPRPRPALAASQVHSAVLTDRAIGAKNYGVNAVDSRFNAYAAYLRRLEEAVEIEWYRILDAMNTAGFQGTRVTVQFTLTSKGQISAIVDTQSTAPNPGTRACLSAITNPAPFEPWTADMIQTMGGADHTDLVFDFFYE